MSDTDIVSAGETLPRIVACKPLEGRSLEIVWRDGSRSEVDVSSALTSRPFYKDVAETDSLFRSCSVSEYGDCIEWADGSELSAVWIAYLAKTTQSPV